jgi:hypothetical protein
MAENTFRAIQEEPKAPATQGKGLFAKLERRLQLEKYFEDGFPVRHLPRVLFVFTLGLIYIGNTHYAEQTVHAINQARTEVEDLRADFTTIKAQLMYSSKQSEVARKVKVQGLEESTIPPFKVQVDPDGY